MDDKNIAEKIKFFIKENTINNTSYWYPLAKIKSGIPVAAYLVTDIYKDNRIDLIEQVLEKCNIRYGDCIQEYMPEVNKNSDIIEMLYEKDEYGYVFPWLTEMFILDRSEKWLIYISHEGTITFTGEEISRAARAVIPEKYEV